MSDEASGVTAQLGGVVGTVEAAASDDSEGGGTWGRSFVQFARWIGCRRSAAFWSTGSTPPLRCYSQPGAFFGFVLSLLLNPREVKMCHKSRRPRANLHPTNLTVASRNGAEPMVKVFSVKFGGWDHNASREYKPIYYRLVLSVYFLFSHCKASGKYKWKTVPFGSNK